MICNEMTPAGVERQVYTTVVGAAILYGLGAVALTKLHEAELEVA